MKVKQGKFLQKNLLRLHKLVLIFFTKAHVALSFFDTALATADLEILDALEENPHFSAAIRQAKIQKSHFISHYGLG